jgi:hypothetical protein
LVIRQLDGMTVPGSPVHEASASILTIHTTAVPNRVDQLNPRKIRGFG